MGDRQRIQLLHLHHAASPEEAAAVVAAIELFLRRSAQGEEPAEASTLDRWRQAALLEGVDREHAFDAYDPWINA